MSSRINPPESGWSKGSFVTMRIAVLLSGRGSNFASLLAAADRGDLGANIALVISNRPGAGGIDIAREAGIDTALIDHQAYHTRAAFDRDLAGAIDHVNPDLVVLAGFMRILTPEFVDRFTGRLMNIHPSLLPLYPGLHTHQRALDSGDRHAGATVHYVTSELDGGPAIVQAKVAIRADDSAETLASRVLEIEHKIYPAAVNWHVTGRLTFKEGILHKDGEPLPPSGHLWEAT